ncbi:hypothetical protein KIPB_005985 [Kipferlia bialata]|uniref:Uncharacterized protein n=1 Tax=Kipferlia bialata TaxID=797122 RepID=A0A9K3CY75_9EUKA|nr:hypothetical protein KIPB_005985 [Kipferlia bialata]|eukprot:g5985.t1
MLGGQLSNDEVAFALYVLALIYGGPPPCPTGPVHGYHTLNRDPPLAVPPFVLSVQRSARIAALVLARVHEGSSFMARVHEGSSFMARFSDQGRAAGFVSDQSVDPCFLALALLKQYKIDVSQRLEGARVMYAV